MKILVPVDVLKLALERLHCVPDSADPTGRTRKAAEQLRELLRTVKS